ncbi:MAG TPA: YciI family protein [Steroidobacteraceae bacterium]|jgi:hypothetical protein|nr:YciI family protein [Steroidobacteraceae bacterium]
MSYMLLVVEPAGQRHTRTETEGRAMYDSMLRFSESLKARGLLTLSQSLKEDSLGARVKVRDGATKIIDGPFAEAKEMIGGIFMLTCKTREQAIAIAAECPVAKSATIEVRELGPCFE